MLRRRQPTVVAQRPPSASFDATHPLTSLFSFPFSRRERAATQAATSARNLAMRLQHPKRKKKRALPLRAVVCVVPRPIARDRGHLGLRPAGKKSFMSGNCMTFFCFFIAVFCVAFTEHPPDARYLGRSTSNSTNPGQPSPTIGHRPDLHTGGAIERDRPRNGPRERAGRKFFYCIFL